MVRRGSDPWAAAEADRGPDAVSAAGTGPAADPWPETSASGQRAIVTAVVVLALVGVLVVFLDWREARDVMVRADWEWLPLAFLVTAVSYFCLSNSFALINRSFGIGMGRRDLLEVGFVSSAMISAIGGLAGHSLRVLLMVRRGLMPGDVMAPSLFHAYMESLVFFALIPAGLAYLLLTHPLSTDLAVGAGVGTGVLGVAFAITAVVFFYGPARAVALSVVRSVARRVVRRDIGPSLHGFEVTLERGLTLVRLRPAVLFLPGALVVADRLARVGVVWLCFQALGGDVGLAVVLTGFTIGVVLGVMSMVPGGLGVQEGSMAGAYHLLGVPLEQAVLAALLFRVLYYAFPFGLSLLLYRRLLREQRLPAAAGT